MTLLLIVLLLGLLLAIPLAYLYLRLDKKYPIDTSGDLSTDLKRGAVFLGQLRALALCNIIVFVTLVTIAIVFIHDLDQDTTSFSEINRVTICDLYNRVEFEPPPELNCPKENP